MDIDLTWLVVKDDSLGFLSQTLIPVVTNLVAQCTLQLGMQCLGRFEKFQFQTTPFLDFRLKSKTIETVFGTLTDSVNYKLLLWYPAITDYITSSRLF
jgi:hypothetical protein